MENQNTPQQQPDNYLVWAILSTIFCCLPLGIVSIIYSTQVNSKWAAGDFEGALKASQNAKKFAIWAAIIWLIFVVLYVIFVFVLGLGTAFFGSSLYNNSFQV